MKLNQWIARNRDGRLYIYGSKPDCGSMCFYGCPAYEIPKTGFPEVTWENSPVKIELELKIV